MRVGEHGADSQLEAAGAPQASEVGEPRSDRNGLVNFSTGKILRLR